MDADTDIVTMERQDLAPGQSWSDLVERDVILDLDLELTPDNPEVVVKRMRNVWILKKEHQPYGHQASACIFRDPRPDLPAESLIEQAGLMWLGSGLTDPDISFAATLGLYGAFGLAKPAALNGPQFLTADVLKTPIKIEDGCAEVPTGPGLGVEVDEDKVVELMKATQLAE